MAEWQTPIFDRTQADVEYAKQQLALGNNNVEYKGCFNATDINRIENNIQYLSDRLNELYYYNNLVTEDSWTKESTVYANHISRIINNVSVLMSAYHTPNSADKSPETLLTYEQANALERNIFLIKVMLDNMVALFRECGTFWCGEEW